MNYDQILQLDSTQMTWALYQQGAAETCLINTTEYLACGLFSEAGEVLSLIKKDLRGDTIHHFETKLNSELADCLWYLALLTSRGELSQLDIFAFLERQEKARIEFSLPLVHDSEPSNCPYWTPSVLLGTAASDILNYAKIGTTLVHGHLYLRLAEAIYSFHPSTGWIKQLAKKNLLKLADRKARNVLRGSGDNR